VPLNISNDWHGRCGERHRLDETSCLIEHKRAADAIGITAFHGDLDIDRAIGTDHNARIVKLIWCASGLWCK
jgi:hypothetical protein